KVNETAETAAEETKKQEETETENTKTEDTAKEISAEETSEVNSEPSAEDELLSMKEQLEESENKYLKLYVEFEYFKRCSRQETDLINEYKDKQFADDLLTVLDELVR